MIPKSLRGRIAFAAAAATAVVIIIGGSAVSVLVDRSEELTLDRRLAEQAVAVEHPVEDALRTGEPVDIASFYAQRPDIGTIVRVYQDGRLLLAAGSPSVSLPVTTDEGYRNVDLPRRSWRMYTTVTDPVTVSGDKTQLVLQVAVPTDATEQAMAAIRKQIFVVGVISAALAAVAGWFLGNVAMRPLGRLRAAAEQVSTSQDLGVRVPSDVGPSEVDDLARTFNVMLERIQQERKSTDAALASSRAFAGNAAHEMRTPLTSMQANLDVLQTNPNLAPSDLEPIVTALRTEQARLVALIGALHTLARGDVVNREHMEQMDLADLAGVSVQSALRTHRRTQIEFVTPEADVNLDVLAWSDGLQVLVDNLIANAVRHGGDRVRVSVDRSQDIVVLAVEDNGSGVDEQDRERIFERFARGRNAVPGGTGLGLALVAQQAKLHDGSVSVGESGELGGARFEVRLPAATKSEPPS